MPKKTLAEKRAESLANYDRVLREAKLMVAQGSKRAEVLIQRIERARAKFEAPPTRRTSSSDREQLRHRITYTTVPLAHLYTTTNTRAVVGGTGIPTGASCGGAATFFPAEGPWLQP